ncbi:MAG: restriction endonuclease subunit S [Saprospiraceae bacterium]
MEIETVKNDVGMSWEMVKLGDVCDVRDGTHDSPKYCQSGYPLITSKNIKDGFINLDEVNFISEKDYLEINKRSKVDKGDILLPMIGTIGNPIIVSEDPIFAIKNICLIKHSSKILNNFLIYILKSSLFDNQLLNQSRGGTQKFISLGDIRSFQIPLPPLPIQRRIAEILDAADALKCKDQQLLKKYDELAQAIFMDMFGDPVKNEKGWKKNSLKNITSKIGSGATPTGGKTAYKTEGISLIRSMNVYDFSFKRKDLAFIDDVQAAKLNNVEVMSKDVLFNITGASVCRCTIVPDKLLPARVNQHVAIIRAKTGMLNPIFLNHLLVSNSIKTKLLGVGSGGGAVMEAITKDQLEQFEIIVPPIMLQNEFEQKINNVFKQKELDINIIAKSEFLFQTLLQKAFKGELVAA